MIALERSGIKVDNYYASEICDYSIRITKKNYLNTIHIGDVRNVNADDIRNIDIIIGGTRQIRRQYNLITIIWI